MNIRTKKGILDLSADFSIEIEEKSPITNDMGSQTVPVTIPCTPHNSVITGFPDRLDIENYLSDEEKSCVVQNGSYVRNGVINVISVDKKNGIALNIGFDNSEAYNRWKNKKLTDLPSPSRTYGVENLCRYLGSIFYQGKNGYSDMAQDLAVFPVITSIEAHEGKTYKEVLNTGASGLAYNPREVEVLLDGTPTKVKYPRGYGVTGFLYVYRVLEYIFEDLGLTILENPFATDKELSTIVVLNNTADACVTGTIEYKNLMPSCTVEEFMHSLYAKFGLVYSIDSNTRTVVLKLIRNIFDTEAKEDFLSKFYGGEMSITYSEHKQLRLSPKCSLKMAGTETEIYEDFVKRLTVGSINILPQNKGNLSAEEIQSKNTAINSKYIIHEKITGNWYRWDGANKTFIRTSSPFFAWDKNTLGVEKEETTGEDECVPMVMDNGLPFPLYCAGTVHVNTYLRTASKKDVDERTKETPLAFLMALPLYESGYTGGTITPYNYLGERIEIDSKPISFSLYYQFTDGLFANFWKKYDAVIRHAFNEIDIVTYQSLRSILDYDFLRPLNFKGQEMLLDTVAYSVPATNPTKVGVKMKTLREIGPVSQEEQQTPVIEDIGELYRWELVWHNREDVHAAKIEELKGKAKQDWLNSDPSMGGYADDEYTQYYVSVDNLITEGYVTPENDEDVYSEILEEGGLTREKQYTCGLHAEVAVYYGGSPVYLGKYNETLSYRATFQSVRLL